MSVKLKYFYIVQNYFPELYSNIPSINRDRPTTIRITVYPLPGNNVSRNMFDLYFQQKFAINIRSK